MSNASRVAAYQLRLREKLGDAAYKEKRRGEQSTCRAQKPELYRATQVSWRAANPSKVKQHQRSWQVAHPGYCNARAMERHARKLQATPSWYDRDLVEALYELSAIYSRETGILYHVDHKVPLQNPTVCGLHTFDNLQIIPARDNMSKGNKLSEGLS